MSAAPLAFDLHKVTPENAAHTIPATLHLIKALALYERDPDAVEATEELLRNAFFGDDKGRSYAQCVLAYAGGKPGDPGAKAIGMACYFFTFSTVSLAESFFSSAFPCKWSSASFTDETDSGDSPTVDRPRRTVPRGPLRRGGVPRQGRRQGSLPPPRPGVRGAQAAEDGVGRHRLERAGQGGVPEDGSEACASRGRFRFPAPRH